ncbi:MAG: hypothetical protein H0X22_08830 [Acidimicrobiia bacterium]|nr:hypothetical protein [Acidimicrobiia bacterium]
MDDQPDRLRADLDRLAPRVDEAAAKALFDRRRATEPPHRGRVLAAAAAVVLLSAGTVAVARITGSDTDDSGPSVSPPVRTDAPPESPPGRTDAVPDPTSGTTSPATAPEGPAGRDFEILDVQAAADIGVLRSAVGTRELRAMWRDAGLAGDVPSVDFNRWVVVTIAIPDDACPPTLSDFDLGADGIRTPVFVETASSCNEPLIPKTYVVLIERAVVTPRFTLRLPGDELLGFDEQTLVIDVPPTDPAPPTTGTVPPRPPDDVGTFPAPAPGDAESTLARDGSPLWIVRHDDGTASALPAVVPVGNTFGNEGLAIEEAASIVHWSPSSRTFRGSITYDEYGRALNSGRDDDLADFTAVVNGDTVIVQTSGVDRVPGSPETIESSPFSEPVGPALPEVVALPAELTPGWSQIDATLVSSDGTWTLCELSDAAAPSGANRCPPEALVADGLTGGHVDGVTAQYYGPLVVHTTADGEIDLIVATRGYSSGVDSDTPPAGTLAS